MNEQRLDKIIRKLYQAQNDTTKSPVRLDVDELMWLCDEASKTLEKDSILLNLKAPITIIGDLHGQFYDLLQFLLIGEHPPKTKYLFLGDYVDRGRYSVETFSLLIALKVRYPDSIWLLRGNHETPEISRLYGFFTECASRYNQNLWLKFNEVFTYLPLAAVVGGRIFCVHGGLSPYLSDLSQISEIKRPLRVPESGLVTDLLWSDPSFMHEGFRESERGTSFTFGPDVVDLFNKTNNFDMVVRAHQVVDPGFTFPFMPCKNCLTIFSAPDYCEEFGNRGGMLKVDFDLKCTFDFVEPPPVERRRLLLRPNAPMFTF
ncbi:Serine/threonine protein phosphatase PP1 isozyme 3 [Tritrichomonas foetus]|uniref:Serine/threonine-protein phosphatase n=1 Tax=Tritrichomonas foetus TaxID=1144522 RepID=A0A1J4JMG7_9EUKA|nr:Serine/threonine protein phosphatase PP1 isozyme 3 [Tritrichomonas foetus]|eukprot:OHS99889.1 Serine/threonine protein phosphatase PP1 isozyme 3 [Tritrichomonas foetus]